MKTIEVKLGKRSYSIWVDRGLLGLIPELIDTSMELKWVIITQRNIQDLFADKITKTLESAGIGAVTIIIPDGEKAKSLSHVESIYHRLLDEECDRSTMLIAFGGGVVGDVTGFVASTYMRGVDYLQVPTTLLAMVDSAIGGKTGVNLPQGKNLAGAFYQPKGVVVDPELLHYLPDRELISAMGEMLKYGAIRDREFFVSLRENMNSLLALDDEKYITNAIARCCEIKADVVSQDERETDLRRILNFGHTIGHALETALGYGILRHGEAVAYGMIAAGHISHQMGYLKQRERDLLESTIRDLPLPELPTFDTTTLLDATNHDKKVRGDSLRFIVLEKLGNAVVTDRVPDEFLSRALEVL